MTPIRRVVLLIAAAIVVLAVGVAGALAAAWHVHAYRLPSQAMSPTLRPGDRVLGRSKHGAIHRGDVVFFTSPPGSGTAFIRVSRVVAVAGDRVDVIGGHLQINGQAVKEGYVHDYPGGTEHQGPITIPEGSVYVMGDNRANSQDSRFYGPLPVSNIVQRAVLRWWPLSRAGGV